MSFIKKFRGLVEITRVDDDDEQVLAELPKKEKKKKTKGMSSNTSSSEVHSDNMADLTEEAHIEKQKELKYKKKPTCLDHILFHEKLRLVYVLLLCLIIGLLIPYLLATKVFNEKPGMDRGYCGLNISYRMECLPGNEVMNEDVCYNATCCYDTVVMDDQYAPLCFHAIPVGYSYTISSDSKTRRTFLPRSSLQSSDIRSLGNKTCMQLNLTSSKSRTPYGEDAWDLNVIIQRIDADVIRIKLWNQEKEPFDENCKTGYLSKYKLDVTVSNFDESLNISVTRDNGSEIFNTAFGPLIYSENYTEITAKINSMHLFGLGQRGNFEFAPDFKKRERWGLFNFDSDTNDDATHSSHPFYMNIENDGSVHGVYLKNSAPMEIGVYPIPSIVFRTLRGSLDLRFFAGPTPHDVTRQYTNMIGKPAMPPYWALGYHLCRTTSEPSEYKNVTDSMVYQELPYESDCVDARLTYPGSFTNLSSSNWTAIEALKNSGRKFWLVQYPFVEHGNKNIPDNVLLEVGPSPNNTQIYYGMVGNETVVYPDYLSNNTFDWMENDKDIRYLYERADGVLLFQNTPLNEVVNFYNSTNGTNCNETHTEYCCPKYPMKFLPFGISDINSNTLCASVYHNISSQEVISHLRMHNAYGLYHHQRISELMKKLNPNRTIVTSQSTHPGSGLFGGQFGGNYQPNFVAQQKGLTQILQMGLYGIPLTGMPICGSINNTDGEMKSEWCLRAHQMATFLPFAMNHYEFNHTARNPPDFSEGFMNQIKYFIRQRYMMIPYMYTLFREAAETGVPVVRPLFYEFPEDIAGRSVMSQFLLGRGLMVTPAFSSVGTGDSINRLAHFPPGCWYDFYTGSVVSHLDKGQDLFLPTLLTDINVHILGGTILPLQGSLHDNFSTTAEARQLPFMLVAALSCDLDSPTTTTTQNPRGDEATSASATGVLYMDDGETPLENVINYHYVTFAANMTSLSISAEDNCLDDNLNTEISSIRVFGLGRSINNVTIDGSEQNFSQEKDTHALFIFNMTIDWCDEAKTINWE